MWQKNHVFALWYKIKKKIHGGPIWSVDTVAQGASTSGQTSMKPTEVRYPNLVLQKLVYMFTYIVHGCIGKNQLSSIVWPFFMA